MSVFREHPSEPFVADDPESVAARNAADRLKAIAETGADVEIRIGSNDETAALPAPAVLLLRQILEAMAKRVPVSVVPHDAEYTTQQAADYLNVSRPYLIKKLDAGEIDHRMVGSHRRILFGDLVQYQRAQREKQKAAMKKLSDEEKKLGLE